MSRISNLVSSETLRNYAQGSAQKAVNPVADFLAPAVEVASPVFRYKTYTAKHVNRIPQTKRALNGRAVELFRDAAETTGELEQHAIDAPVDIALLINDGDLENELKSAADDISAVAGLAHEKTVIDMALASVGSGTNSNFTSSSVDPVDILDEQIKNVLKAAAYGSLMGVGLLFGATAWQRYKNNSNVRARFVGGKGSAKAGDGGASLVVPNLDAVSALQLANPEARMSLMVYDANAEGLSASNTFVLDTGILIFARLANPTRNDPSFMKTFRPRGQWMVPGSYMRDDGRAEVAKMDWAVKAAVTNSGAVARINATNS
jgi:hypothetical protein